MAITSRPGLVLNILFWLGITAFGVYFMMNLVGRGPEEKGFLNFGIDLVGGTYLTLDVKVEDAIKNDLMGVMQNLVDELKKERKVVGVPKVEDTKGTLAFETEAAAAEALKIFQARSSEAKVVQDGANLNFMFSPVQIAELQKEAVEGNISILRTRLDAFGAGEVAIIPHGERRISIELPNVSDPEKAKARIGTAAILELKPVYDFAYTEEQLLQPSGGEVPEGTMVVAGRKGEQGFFLVPIFAKVTGKMLRNAQYKFVPESLGRHSPHKVAIEFKPDGKIRFAELTRDNVGKQIAIILDNVVISAPMVNQPLEDGYASIEGGNFDQEKAEELVTLLKSGAFSAPVEVIEERTIGPSLGKEAVRQGLLSCGIALGLLFLFSIIVYKVAGLFAFIVLLYNLLLILFGLALVPDATLTLPGIAGMILTVGMAIDSSILIYERIKEDLAVGSSLRHAVDAGFGGALTVILDANITTFIIGAVLYYLGSPAIQGFALTLMIGIIATLVTGLVLLKTLFNIVLSMGVTSLKI